MVLIVIMGKIKLARYIFNQLYKEGVRRVFGVPGGGCMHLFEAATSTKGIKTIPSFHEQSSGFAAQSFSDIKNNISICLVTSGPGLTNAISPMTACWIESTPVIFIGGQAKTEDLAIKFGIRSLGQQEINGTLICKSITKLSVRIDSAKNIYHLLKKAVFLANNGRKGPVYLEIPLDIQATIIDNKPLKKIKKKNIILAKNKHIIKNLIDDLTSSAKPVMLIGAGSKLPHTFTTLVKICEKFCIPILLTWKVFGNLSENHKLNFGRPGNICQPYSNDILQEADLFISVGARNDLVSTAFNHATYAANSKKRYFVDIDQNELKKYKLKKDINICLDSEIFVRYFKNKIIKKNFSTKNKLNWLNYCSKIKKNKNIFNYIKINKDYSSTYLLNSSLSIFFDPRKHMLIPGSSGACSDILMQSFKVKSKAIIQNAPGFGAMGTGLPAIIGASQAFPNKKVISIIGDGGFQFNLQELQTIKNLDINAVIFVLNNNGYASIRRSQINHFKRKFHADSESDIILSNLNKISKAFDFKYQKISTNNRLDSFVKKLLNQKKGQFLVELIIDPDEDVRPRIGTKIIGKTIMSSNLNEYR